MMAALGLAKVDYKAWVQYFWKLCLLLHLVGFGMIILANTFGYGPF